MLKEQNKTNYHATPKPNQHKTKYNNNRQTMLQRSTGLKQVSIYGARGQSHLECFPALKTDEKSENMKKMPLGPWGPPGALKDTP